MNAKALALWWLILIIAAGALLNLLGWPQLALLWFALVVAAGWLYHRWHLYVLSLWSRSPNDSMPMRAWGSWVPVVHRLARHVRRESAAREVAARELERLHAAVDLMPDGLIVMDSDNIVHWSNQTATELHGIAIEQRPVDHFIRAPEFTKFLKAGDFRKPVLLPLPGKPGRMYQIKLVPTPDSWRLLITRDVTEQSKLDTMRRDFVANVSHEIRTPLTVVSGYIETLIDIDLPRDETVEYLKSARKQSLTMQRLLADLLTLSSLESTDVRPEEQSVPIPSVLRTLVSDARTLSAGQHEISIGRVDSFEIMGVQSEIESALRNLLTNAVRYTPAGGTIRMEAVRTEDGASIRVEDTGIGIAQEHLPRITERFYRVDRSRSRDTGGTGLGLAIVKHVAQRHGARLNVTSALGKGSCFSLDFGPERIGESSGD